MAKSKKVKKSIFTLGLVAALVTVNYFSVQAGVNRQFWNMSIRAYQGKSVLTTRYKATNSQCSWVKVTSMASVGKIYTSFEASTYSYTNNLIVSNGVNTGVWLKQAYVGTTSHSGWPIALSVSNYNLNKTTGKLNGWVDYE